MTEISDLFAYLYTADLPTLDLIVDEAIRILAERQRTDRRPPINVSAPKLQ
jgi:hypothetical protein